MLDELGLTYPQYLVMMLLWETDHHCFDAREFDDLESRLCLLTDRVSGR